MTPERIDGPGRPTLTAADLERWQDGGATWRMLELDEDRAIVELCTCTGEPVDVLSGTGPELVAFIRTHAAHAAHTARAD